MDSARTIVVCLESGGRAAEVQSRLDEVGFHSLVADSSDQIRRLGNQSRVDCLVIEQELSGFLTGIEVVERLRRELLNPVVVLIGEVPPDQYSLLRELKVEFVLPRSATVDVIVDSVRASFVVTGPRSLRIPLAARQIAEASDCFAPLPQLVVGLMGRLGEQDADLSDLAAQISTDPRLTAELLRITNSSASGLRFKVHHLEDAIKYLGFRRTLTLVVAIAQKALHGGGLRKLPDWVDPWYRTRAVLTASVGHAFAEQHLAGQSETVYVAGLLQDLGILALANHLGPRYLRLIERTRQVGHLQLLVGEHQQFNVDHAEVSAALLQKWGVPVTFIALVLNHHDDKPKSLTEVETRSTEILQFAEAVADMHDAPSPQRQHRLLRMSEALGGLRSESTRVCLARAIAKTAEFEKLLQIPVPAEDILARFVERLSLEVTEGGFPDEPEVVPSSAARTSVDRTTGRRLLVIEDDQGIIELVNALLEREDISVIPAVTAEEALGVIDDCDGALCDIHLAGMSGIDFVARTRARGYSGMLVMLTGDRTRDSVVRAAQSGATGYLLKPFTRQDLLSILKRHQLLG